MGQKTESQVRREAGLGEPLGRPDLNKGQTEENQHAEHREKDARRWEAERVLGVPRRNYPRYHMTQREHNKKWEMPMDLVLGECGYVLYLNSLGK